MSTIRALRSLRSAGVPSSAATLQSALQPAATAAGVRLSLETKLPTERLVQAGGKLPRGHDAGQLLLLTPNEPARRAQTWPDAETPALAHPGLPAMCRIAARLGHKLVIDTSLCAKELEHVGAYQNSERKCIGLAVDSLWHELVHEMVHLQLHQPRGASGAVSNPLHVHLDALCERGFSEHAAEEMLAKEHELHAVEMAGHAWSVKALILLDTWMRHAQEDLSALPSGARTRAQARELARARLTRVLVSSGATRLFHLLLGVAGASLLASNVTRALIVL